MPDHSVVQQQSRVASERGLTQSMASCTGSNPTRTANQPQLSDHERNIKRVVALYLANHKRKALQTLMREPLCPDTPELRLRLLALHPTRTNKPALPKPPVAPPTIINPELLRKAIRKCANGSARSISGWTGDLIADITEDDDIFEAILTLTQAQINNNLPESARQLLLQCRLMASAKKGDITDPRPIILLEPFYKLAATYSLMIAKPSISSYLKAHNQFGCVKCG